MLTETVERFYIDVGPATLPGYVGLFDGLVHRPREVSQWLECIKAVAREEVGKNGLTPSIVALAPSPMDEQRTMQVTIELKEYFACEPGQHEAMDKQIVGYLRGIGAYAFAMVTEMWLARKQTDAAATESDKAVAARLRKEMEAGVPKERRPVIGVTFESAATAHLGFINIHVREDGSRFAGTETMHRGAVAGGVFGWLYRGSSEIRMALA